MKQEKFGLLTPIRIVKNGKDKVWECQCDCGNLTQVFRSNLISGHTKSCGCLKKHNNNKMTLIDIQKKYENDPHNITPISINEETDVITMLCNNCNHQFTVSRANAINQFRNCPFCGDGISYPNKFLRNFILQLPIDNFKFEYEADWSQEKKYDAYFSYQGKQYVVEIDGQQHHRDALYTTIEEQEENDALKNELAQKANFIMIRIDAVISSSEYIIEQIQNSLFNDIFDLSQINWEECKLNAAKSTIIAMCKYLNKHPECTSTDLAKYFHIGTTTVARYLKYGEDLSLLNSNFKEALKEAHYKKIQQTNIDKGMTKPFNAYDIKTGKLLGTFYSLRQGQDELRKIMNNEKINKKNISQVLNNQKHSHYGISFSYIQ